MKTIKTKVSNNLEVVIIASQEHEFLMTTKEVAQAYEVSDYAVRKNMHRNPLDFIENKHFVKGWTICPTLSKGVRFSHTPSNHQPHQIFWTKRGIVRLGFFIKSERAKLFRDWAEDLVLEQLENQNAKRVLEQLPEAPKRRHNRLTVERINDIMKYVCMIEDKSLRMIIAEKLNN